MRSPDARDDRLVRLRSDDVVAREVQGRVVALNLATSTYLDTNQSGTVLWQLLEAGPTTVAALAETLCDEFGIDAEVAVNDAAAFVDQLVLHGLADVVEE